MWNVHEIICLIVRHIYWNPHATWALRVDSLVKRDKFVYDVLFLRVCFSYVSAIKSVPTSSKSPMG